MCEKCYMDWQSNPNGIFMIILMIYSATKTNVNFYYVNVTHFFVFA